jgi:opacity protein-like surface antigen
MKKLLLTAASVSAILASSVQAHPIKDTFYLKVNVGGSRLEEYKASSKFKSENNIHFGVGAGYHIMENVRFDWIFDHFVNPNFKASVGKVEATVNTLLLNGYFDVYSLDALRMFVGAGVGGSQIGAKSNVTAGTPTGKVKQKYTIAFAGYAGLGYEFTKDVVGELSYSYRHMGKTSDFADNTKGVELKGHHLTVGVRFDI